MIEHFGEVRALHVAAALASGGLFLLRGIAMWVGSGLGMTAPVRYLSYAIDTVLLGAAVALAVMLHRVPLEDRWITLKLALVALYVVFGSFALKRAPTLRARRVFLVAALLVFGLVLTLARGRGSIPWTGAAAP